MAGKPIGEVLHYDDAVIGIRRERCDGRGGVVRIGYKQLEPRQRIVAYAGTTVLGNQQPVARRRAGNAD